MRIILAALLLATSPAFADSLVVTHTCTETLDQVIGFADIVKNMRQVLEVDYAQMTQDERKTFLETVKAGEALTDSVATYRAAMVLACFGH